MRLRDIMTLSAQTIRPDATLQEAAALMKATEVGALPVADGGRIIGMLSDRDVVTRATAKGLDPMLARVRDVMTREVDYAFDDQNVEDAASLMEERLLQRLVVVNRDRHIVGVVSASDVSMHSHHRKLAGRVLERRLDRPSGYMLH
jgi:CBS domain-containing protein